MFSSMYKMNSNRLNTSFFAMDALSILSKRGISTISKGIQVYKDEGEKKRHNLTILNRFQPLKEPIRTLSSFNHVTPLAEQIRSKNEKREFLAIFPDVIKDLTEYASKYVNDDAVNWYAKAMEYNVPLGSKVRPLITMLTYKNLVDKSQLSPDNIKLVQYLGWCIELFQGAFLILDSILDGDTMRRGQTCWHKLQNVGIRATNDAFLLQHGLFYILKKYFGQQNYYENLIELFHETMFMTTLGQILDEQISKGKVSSFTMDKLKNLAVQKTGYYTFNLPVALGLHLAGIRDPEIFRQVKPILLEMGYLYQVNNDFLDCYGNPDITGKIGTDIEENKCSWLAVICMERASEVQKEIMRECYGKNDALKVERVKQLYTELKLPEIYIMHEKETYDKIKTHIEGISKDVLRNILYAILNNFSQRDS